MVKSNENQLTDSRVKPEKTDTTGLCKQSFLEERKVG
jgi:hypothetical protein